MTGGGVDPQLMVSDCMCVCVCGGGGGGGLLFLGWGCDFHGLHGSCCPPSHRSPRWSLGEVDS